MQAWEDTLYVTAFHIKPYEQIEMLLLRRRVIRRPRGTCPIDGVVVLL